MTDLRTAAQMALDALRETETYNTGNQEQYRLELDAMEALRAALSRPEPEPVADGIQVIEHVRNVQYKIKSRYHLENGTELYTAPPKREWQGLTEEIQRMAKRIEELEGEQEEKPEPVAWWHDMGDVVDLNVSGRGVPLYTAPPRQEEKQDAPKESFVSMKEKPQAWMLITEAGACRGTFRYRVDVEVAARNLGGWFAIVPLYMSPQKREWKGLTDEEVNAEATTEEQAYGFVQGVVWAEAKLKEKNT